MTLGDHSGVYTWWHTKTLKKNVGAGPSKEIIPWSIKESWSKSLSPCTACSSVLALKASYWTFFCLYLCFPNGRWMGFHFAIYFKSQTCITQLDLKYQTRIIYHLKSKPEVLYLFYSMHQWTKVQTICHFQGSFHIHFYIAFKIKKKSQGLQFDLPKASHNIENISFSILC